MINVTYHGDLLVAYKVTGDKNVPRGEITFQVDLNPTPPRVVGGDKMSSSSMGTAEPLQPISLTEKAAKKWGTTQLPRHKGLGQVAEPGFTNNQWMDGQLIIIGEEFFSFAWVPIEQQIFFGRPSPELALKMLRESGATTVTRGKTWETPPSMDEDVKVLKEFVSSCLEKTTETVEEELNGDPFSCIWTGSETEECYFQ
jgi:Cyclin D1 binding domain